MPDAELAVEQVAAGRLKEVRPMLLALLSEDQQRYGQGQPDGAGLAGLVGDVRPRFDGENLVLGIRRADRLVAFCWCVFYDPGTGYEAEIAEVYVSPESRGQGLATRLVQEAVDLFRERAVTFACVWTHPSNDAAVRLYEGAGFAPTEQVVLTWLPGAR
ncbi:MAG: GNAT family N-acetyltransferase [Candidatus Dormibacteria bacterium]